MQFLGRSATENFLRAALALAFLYPPIDAWFDSNSWVGYFPSFISSWPVSAVVLLHSFGVIEILLALWVLFGKNPRIPALVMATLLLVIVLFNLPQFPVLFRDVSIALAALALAFWPRTARAA